MAFVLAFAGWMMVDLGDTWIERVQIALYRAFSVNTLSDHYGESFARRDITWPASGFLTAARWLGVLTFSLFLFKAYQGLFSERFARLVAGSRSGHIVIIGETPFARAAAEEASRLHPVVWVTNEAQVAGDASITRISMGGDGNQLVKATAAHKARSVLVSMEEDSQTFTTAREVLRADQIYGQEAEKASKPLEGPHVFAIVSDQWDAYPDEAAKLISPHGALDPAARDGGLDSVGEIITEARTAARAMLGNVPLFQLARDTPQHVVILGLGDLGEAILTEICESQRTDLHAKQRVTIIDKSEAAWNRFTNRVPDYDDVFDGHFFNIAAESADDGAWKALLSHVSRYPVTAAYVTSGGANSSRLASSELRTHLVQACGATETGARDFSTLAFPIFAYSRSHNTTGIDALKRETLASSTLAEERMPILSFGAWSELVSAARLFDAEPDQHAFEIHNTHTRLYAKAGDTPQLWRDLTEWQRYSSRSASAYTATLLHVAGYDLSAWYAAALASDTAVTLNDLPRLGSVPDFSEEIPLLMKLARLEHTRWCAERRLKGYRWGPVKDPGRRHHPGLVDFDDLDPGSQQYNIRYIQSLFTTLAEKTSDLVVTRRSDATPAIARPTDIGLLKRLGMFPADAETGASDGDV
ncbi:MAG: RyR domain-containing protein [Pseudomonadota bacterium]